MADASALDAGLERQLAQLGEREVGGWKVGLTSGAARDGMGPGFRPFGYILKERVFASGHVFERAGFRRVGVENELCFRLREPLRGDVGRGEAMAAVASIHPAFEINEPRLPAGASAADRLADNLNQYAIVVGAEAQLAWASFDFNALRVVLSRDGQPLQTVAAAGHIDDHFASIAALARQLGRFGRGLAAGDHVITGAYARAAVEAPGLYRGDFGASFAPVCVGFQ